MPENKPIVNPFRLDPQLLDELSASPLPDLEVTALPGVDADAMYVDNVFTPGELAAIQTDIEAQEWIPVGINGILSDYRPGQPIGSYRASCLTPELADVIWQRIQGLFLARRGMGTQTKTDWQPHPIWEPVGINPLMRFINYRRSGVLIPHYDAPYDDPEAGQRTLVTVVVYLRSDPGLEGGHTRFIADPQDKLPFAERDFSDLDQPAAPDEVIAAVDPVPGRVLIFDHRILHDSSALTGEGQKTILRTDVLYRPIG